MSDGNIHADAPAWLKITAVVVALAGLVDAAYLTSNHFAGTAVPCNLVSGCETVLTSAYSEIFGIPTALFGTAAYFTAFSLALLSYFGRENFWKIFGAVSALMFLFSMWFVYLQAFVIKAFCQFCLISAATSTLLFVIFSASVLIRKR